MFDTFAADDEECRVYDRDMILACDMKFIEELKCIVHLIFNLEAD